MSRLHRSGTWRQTGFMPRFGRNLPWLGLASATCVAAACGACSGDYWLGGSSAPIVGAGPNDRILDADIVLQGDDPLEIAAPPGATCRLIGNGHAIRSDRTWTGHLSIVGCTVEDLGSAMTPAIEVVMSGSASTTIEGVTFGTSGTVHVTNEGDSTTT